MFSKKPVNSRSQSATKPMAGSATFSVIGTDVAIKGDIAASADLHVEGSVDGDIECSSLVQGEGGIIRGSIKAENARLSGQVQGSILVRDLVVLKSAKINGDVLYDTLTIEQGAMVEGKFSQKPLDAQPASSGSESSTKPNAKPGNAEPRNNGDEPHLTLAG